MLNKGILFILIIAFGLTYGYYSSCTTTMTPGSIFNLAYLYGGSCSNINLIQNVVEFNSSVSAVETTINGYLGVGLSKTCLAPGTYGPCSDNSVIKISPTLLVGNNITLITSYTPNGGATKSYSLILNNVTLKSSVFENYQSNYTITEVGSSSFNISNETGQKISVSLDDGNITLKEIASSTAPGGDTFSIAIYYVDVTHSTSTNSYSSTFNSTHLKNPSGTNNYFTDNLQSGNNLVVASYADLYNGRQAKVLLVSDSSALSGTPSGWCNATAFYSSQQIKPKIWYSPFFAKPYTTAYEFYNPDNSVFLMPNNTAIYAFDDGLQEWFFIPGFTCTSTAVVSNTAYLVNTESGTATVQFPQMPIYQSCNLVNSSQYNIVSQYAASHTFNVYGLLNFSQSYYIQNFSITGSNINKEVNRQNFTDDFSGYSSNWFQLATMDTDEIWANEYLKDSLNYKQGNQSVKVNATTSSFNYGYTAKNMDLSGYNLSGYNLTLWVYNWPDSNFSYALIVFRNNIGGSPYFSYNALTSNSCAPNTWCYVNVPLNQFTKSGAADWATIVSFDIYTFANASGAANVSYDDARLIKNGNILSPNWTQTSGIWEVQALNGTSALTQTNGADKVLLLNNLYDNFTMYWSYYQIATSNGKYDGIMLTYNASARIIQGVLGPGAEGVYWDNAIINSTSRCNVNEWCNHKIVKNGTTLKYFQKNSSDSDYVQKFSIPYSQSYPAIYLWGSGDSPASNHLSGYFDNISIDNLTYEPTTFFTLDTSNLISQGKLRIDCKDLLINDSYSLTGYPTGNIITNESNCNTANTSIFFNGTANQSYYLYYGNKSYSMVAGPYPVLVSNYISSFKNNGILPYHYTEATVTGTPNPTLYLIATGVNTTFAYNVTNITQYSNILYYVDNTLVCQLNENAQGILGLGNINFPPEYNFLGWIFYIIVLALGTAVPFLLLLLIAINDIFGLMSGTDVIASCVIAIIAAIINSWQGAINLKSIVPMMFIMMGIMSIYLVRASIANDSVNDMFTKASALAALFDSSQNPTLDFFKFTVVGSPFLISLFINIITLPNFLYGIFLNLIIPISPTLASFFANFWIRLFIVLSPYVYFIAKGYETIQKLFIPL